MKIKVRKNEKKALNIIDIEGEVDVYTSMDLKKELNAIIDEGEIKLLINLEKVTYMDSSGLGILVALLKRLKKENGVLKITNLTSSIKKIFELTRLTKFFEIFDSETDAIESF